MAILRPHVGQTEEGGENPHGRRSSRKPLRRPRPRELRARDGVSREVPCSALKGETVPDSLPATPRSPPTRRVPPRALEAAQGAPRDPRRDSRGERSPWLPLETQAWKPGSQHAGEKRGVAGLLLGRTERAARAAELQLCAQTKCWAEGIRVPAPLPGRGSTTAMGLKTIGLFLLQQAFSDLD